MNTYANINSATLQPGLFDADAFWVVQPEYEKSQTPAERFQAFHDKNPWIYDALLGLALDMRSRGVTKWGIKAALEVVRWQYTIRTNTDDFKINNNYAPYYARVIMANEAGLAGFFEIRKMHGDW
ncbi:MAG: hypothetical protein ACOYD4_11685 [Solirubrobacterales bacterium]